MRNAFDSVSQDRTGLTRDQIDERWIRMIVVNRPRTGIEVVNDSVGEDGVRRITFRDLRTGEVSAPWRVEELKEGSVREYAARMSRVDGTLDESIVRWWGNLGYLRPMRSQVDLVYRDEHGVDHIYYAARREELRDEWRALLDEWEEPNAQRPQARQAGAEHAVESQIQRQTRSAYLSRRPFDGAPWGRGPSLDGLSHNGHDLSEDQVVALHDDDLSD